MEDKNELCDRLLADDHALNVAVARLLPVVLGEVEEEREYVKEWDGGE